MLKQINILNVPHEVRFDEGDDGDLDGYYGKVDHVRRIIKISKLSPLESQMRTFLHEILHAIDEATAMEKKFSENQVKRMATGLFSVLVSNPELLSMLQEVATGQTGTTKPTQRSRPCRSHPISSE